MSTQALATQVTNFLRSQGCENLEIQKLAPNYIEMTCISPANQSYRVAVFESDINEFVADQEMRNYSNLDEFKTAWK